ncbi:hypothetical protein pb186bvf_004764 [Paramecium bursaria]
MNSIIIYLTGSNPRISEIVCQVFTSQVPLGLQQVQLLNHQHVQIFDVGILIKSNQCSVCECSVWKNLLRYIIFLDKKYEQRLNIERYLPHLFIDHYAITKTFVEMIPFQIQQFTKAKFYCEKMDKNFSLYVPLNYQEGFNEYLQSQEVQAQECLQIQTNEVQISSQIFCICYQLDKKMIQYFQLHQQEIDYIAKFIQQGVLSSRRFSRILNQLIVYLFRKLDKPQIIFCLNEILQDNHTNSYAYKLIIDLIPCQPYQWHQKYDISHAEKDVYRLILNQCHIIRHFDKLFYDLIQNCQDKLQKLQLTRILLQAFVKKLNQRYPQNNQNQFELEKLQFLFAQFVSADHIIIILLSFYCQLKQAQKGQQFLSTIIEDLQISHAQLKQLFNNLAAQRAIQNLVLINATKYFIYYCRRKTLYNFNNIISEFSQESLDYSIVQMYFFLYGEDAIVTAYNYVHYLNKIFKTNFICDRFINKALSSDFDMFQAYSHYFQDELPQESKAALRKVIKSLFYAQNYLSFQQILHNLNEMGNNQLNMLNSNYLLEILDLEPYSGQLQLKKQFQPQLYEPLFFNNQALHAQIQDKLNENNNLEVTIFGNSIEYDFLCEDENQKTLSFIRKHIIEQIFNGQNKIFSLLLVQLKSVKDVNIKRKIILSNKYLIYLLIVASKHLKIPKQNQQVLQELFDIILQLHVQNDIIDILQKKIKGNEQGVQVKQSNHNDQKLNLMKQKFQKKQQAFEKNFEKDQIIKKDYDPSLICNFCAQQMEVNDGQQLVLLQLNNNIIFTSQFQDLQYLQYLQNISKSQSEITFSGCSHKYHKKCTKQLKIIELNEESFYQCEICKSLGNMIFPVKYQNSKEIFQDIGYFSILSKTEMLEYYYKAYNVNSELDIKQVNAEIYLQIYLYLIRQIIGNSNFYDSLDNVQKFKQVTLLLKQSMDDFLTNFYFRIISKYPQSVIFSMFKCILVNRFNIETQQFTQEIEQIIGSFKLLGLCNYDIFQKLFKYQPENHQFQNLKSIIVQKVEQFTNLKDLQMRSLQKCIDCKKLTQYICIGCNQKLCIGIKVILDYKKSFSNVIMGMLIYQMSKQVKATFHTIHRSYYTKNHYLKRNQVKNFKVILKTVLNIQLIQLHSMNFIKSKFIINKQNISQRIKDEIYKLTHIQNIDTISFLSSFLSFNHSSYRNCGHLISQTIHLVKLCL